MSGFVTAEPNQTETRLMKTNRPGSASARRLALALAVCVTAGVFAQTAGAAEPSYYGPAGRAGVTTDGGSSDSSYGRRMDLSIGRSVVIELPRDAKEVFVANPGVANAVVRSARKIFLIGIANGATSIFAMDADGRQIASFDVNVGRDLTVLRQTLRATIPNGRIDVKPAGDSILLTGTVPSAGDAQQANDIAKAFVGQQVVSSASGGAASAFNGNVINALTIVGRDQVMLKVSVIEVSRSALKQLGISIGGSWNLVGAANAFVNPISSIAGLGTGVAGALSGGGANISGQTAIPGSNSTVGGTLTALENAGVSRVLAEPTLVAISGESANFLAGGELPIPSTPTCSSGTSGSASVCTPTVTFKPFGVSLAFTPTVLNEGRISMRVGTEVTEIDKSNSLSIQGTTVPGFRVRRSTTTVELPSGAAMVTAGLISQQSSQTISGVPGLINLPVLGALFRSRDYQRQETELMIMVTPYIAKPIEPTQVRRPDDGFLEAQDSQTVLLGRLNKVYGNSPAPMPASARGRFGFITD